MDNLHINWIICLLLQVFFLSDYCLSFNVDIRSPIVHNGPVDTEFGFSVELHREQNTNWLLVGAPRAQTNQTDVEEGGAIFRCPVLPVDNPGECTEIVFDGEGNPTNGNKTYGSKSNQRLGYSLTSSGPDGPVVACAPLRQWYTDEGTHRFPVGGCYVARNNFTDITENSPCMTNNMDLWKRNGPVYCQAGMSAIVNKDMVVMGGPGAYYSQGGIYVDNFDSSIIDPPQLPDISKFDDSYRGYSITFAEFYDRDNTEPDIVIGMPRPAIDELKGQVELYTATLFRVDKIEGEQVGSFFGNSVAATDLNGDGKDDIIVGAPMYSDEARPLEGWEVGRVYVFFQEKTGEFPSFTEVQRFTGKKKQARFGFSVAAIGDMDRDGFNDFAVGAPYEGDDELGAVYIYHGRRKGLDIKLAQTIYPSDLGLSINSFGYSLASGLDMDDNAYIDLLVGAFNSSAAVLLRSRPVVRVSVAFTITPDPINLDVVDTQLSDGTMVTGFDIITCLSYTGEDVPENIELDFTMVVDSERPITSRVTLLSNNDYVLSNLMLLQRDTQNCFTEKAYVKDNIREKQQPIGVFLNYTLPINETSLQPGELSPILDQAMDLFASTRVLLDMHCKNPSCKPDLQVAVNASKTPEVVIGAGDSIFVDVIVMNDGEEAFDAQLIAYFDEGLQFQKVENIQSDMIVSCSEDAEGLRLTCDLANPFPENHVIAFGIRFDTAGLTGDSSEVTINMEVKGASDELQNTTADNFDNVTIGVRAEAQITLNGASDPTISLISAADQTAKRDIITEADAGPLVSHFYTLHNLGPNNIGPTSIEINGPVRLDCAFTQLRNLGPSNIGPTSIEIKWPVMYSRNQYLLYLTSATMREANMNRECEINDGQVNPEGLTLEMQTNNSVSYQQNRRRRQANGNDIDCDTSPGLCYTIRCRTRDLIAGSDLYDSVTIVIRSRLWLDTISEIPVSEFRAISTSKATVQSMPYAIAPSVLPTRTEKASTLVVLDAVTKAPPTPLPFWVYIAAAGGGLLLLIIIIVVLVKCGFFRRKTYSMDSNINGGWGGGGEDAIADLNIEHEYTAEQSL